MSGHSKWAKIKHKKGAEDAKRGALFTKLSKEVTAAAKEGGRNIDTNFRLRAAIARTREYEGTDRPLVLRHSHLFGIAPCRDCSFHSQ